MSNRNNIKIRVNNQFDLDYESPEALGIKFNRIVEDFTDLSKRFGEFSYTFSLPKTKINIAASEYADTKGRRGIFKGTQKPCKVFNNDVLILDGIIELRKITATSFEYVFFSKFTELIDTLTGSDDKEKTLRDIISLGSINNFQYETTIRNHIGNQSANDPNPLDYEFPFSYYSTYFTPKSILDSAANDFNNNPFLIPDNYLQNWYYILSSNDVTNTNQFYTHQFPLAIYIIPILESILRDAGWSLGGSFFQRPEIAKLILMFTGDNDIYDQAIGCPEGVPIEDCSTVNNDLWLPTFLPEISQVDFIKGLMNMFNLYFTIDINNRVINFETWDVLFGDTVNSYNITDKVFSDTIQISKIDNYDPSITYKDSENMRVLGDNKVMVNNATTTNFLQLSNTEEKYTKEVFNHIGSTSGEIELPFALPNIGRKYLRQDVDLTSVDKNGLDFQIFLPILTSQTPQDNDNKPFYKSTGDTFINNDVETIKYKGDACIMWYYGLSRTNYQIKTGTDNFLFYYTRIGTLGRTSMTFANPFKLMQREQLEILDDYLSSSPTAKSRKTAEASYLKGLHYNMGRFLGFVSGTPPYSLTFGGSDDALSETLYTEFHKNKYDLYFNSELFSARMRMNEFDWNEMQINRTIEYDQELYKIIAIENYDIVASTAEIKLIKI